MGFKQDEPEQKRRGKYQTTQPLPPSCGMKQSVGGENHFGWKWIQFMAAEFNRRNLPLGLTSTKTRIKNLLQLQLGGQQQKRLEDSSFPFWIY